MSYVCIRGPDVAQGVTTDLVSHHVHMAPTILQMLGVPEQDSFAFDGSPISYTSDALNTSPAVELVNVEFWNSLSNPELLPAGSYYNNTYKALRLMSDGHSFYYSKWCNGDSEFYDMVKDPAQMQNRLAMPPKGSASKYYKRKEKMLFNRLDALLMVAKSCKQHSCRNPWSILFPNGEVTNLADAMKLKYDKFFAKQPKVSYGSCEFASGVIMSLLDRMLTILQVKMDILFPKKVRRLLDLSRS